MPSKSLFSFLSLSALVASSPTKPSYPPQPSDTQHLTLDFTSRTLAGQVHVTVQPNNDPTTAFGLSLIYPDVAPANISANFAGFPVVHGPITYPIPANPYPGYGSLFGWIQFISQTGGANWTVDSYPYALDLGDPFGGYVL